MLGAFRSTGAFSHGVFLTLAAAVLWGSMAVAAQLIMAEGVVDAVTLVVVRLCCAGALLLIWSLYKTTEDVRKIFTVVANLRDVVFGAFFIYAGQFAFLQAIRYSNAGAAAIVLTTVPLWVALWEAIVNRRLPTPRMMLCFVLAASGVALIVTKGEFNIERFNLQGLLWAVGCAVMTAAYSVQPRELLKRVSVIAVMGCAMLFGGLMAAGVAVFGGKGLSMNALDIRTAALLGHVVILGTLVSFCCYMAAIRLISPVIVGILGCAEPVTAYVISVFALDQEIGSIELAGIVLVLTTVVLLAVSPRKSVSGEDIAHRWKESSLENTK